MRIKRRKSNISSCKLSKRQSRFSDGPKDMFIGRSRGGSRGGFREGFKGRSKRFRGRSRHRFRDGCRGKGKDRCKYKFRARSGSRRDNLYFISP